MASLAFVAALAGHVRKMEKFPFESEMSKSGKI